MFVVLVASHILPKQITLIKLTSVFHASILLLITDFVIILSKYLWIPALGCCLVELVHEKTETALECRGLKPAR